jgi:hypothetical protein
LVQGIETTRVDAFVGQCGLGVECQLDFGAGGDERELACLGAFGEHVAALGDVGVG